MHVERGVVRLGAEIEVAAWKRGADYKQVAKKLLKAGYMMGDEALWEQWHTYHCSCEEGGCATVRKGTLVDPPLVSMTYDSTLPKNGAEFIMSPVLLADQGMPHFESIWKLVTENAEWTRSLRDQKDRPTSPSVHLHVSAQKSKAIGRNDFSGDVLHALTMFSPEFFLLADTAGVRRGLQYRLPDRESMMNLNNGIHHGFIQVRQATRDSIVYIEWRLFEAAYTNWKYIEACAYLAAGLTRAFLQGDIFSQLMATGYGQPYSSEALQKAVRNDDSAAVLAQAHPQRLDTLRSTVLTSLDDDNYASAIVSDLFDAAGSTF